MGGKHAIFGILFVIGAAVQYNDPDGLLWGAWYAGAAAACFAADRRPKEAAMGAVILFLGSVAWILAIVGGGMHPVTLSELVGTLGMKTESVERWREAGGLGIIAVWMLIISIEGLRPKRS
jgi:hypothetical protein